jgi:glutathione S-transferase
MPKLYYTPTSCGAASFITAKLSGVVIEAEQVSLQTHLTDSGVDFYTINPKGNVPALRTDDGTILNENAASLQFIADLDPNHTLLPAWGTTARYEVIAALSYVGTEYHASIGGLFNPAATAEIKEYLHAKLATKLAYLNDKYLNGKRYLTGDNLSVADIYLYICLSWSPYVGVDLSPYPTVKAFFEGIGELEGVKAAHAAIATKPSTTA